MMSEPMQVDVGIFDGMLAAADETLRVMPTASLLRGAGNLLDSSRPLDPSDANERFGLEGEAAFALDDEEVTVSKAQARADDQARIARNELITGLVNEESPIAGRLTQFVASMASGFVDPVLMGINVGAGVALSRGVGSLAQGNKVLGAVIKANPDAGRALLNMYGHGARQSLLNIAGREGVENLIATVAEESINFVGIGEERMARKVTTAESLMNIVIGTTLGTGFGIALDKGGREALSRQWRRLHGDNAPDVALTQSQVNTMEQTMGLPSGNFANRMLDREKFTGKDWHQEVQFEYVDNSVNYQEGNFYISFDEQGQLLNYSERGTGIVLTNNVSHAQNAGKRVRELDVSQVKLLDNKAFAGDGKRTPRIRSRIVNAAVDAVFNATSNQNLLRMYAHRIGVPFASAEVPAKVKTQLKKDFRDDIAQLEDIDSIFDYLERSLAASGTELNFHKAIDDVLLANGYDGYTFTGKNVSGENAYTGAYILAKTGADGLAPTQKMRTKIDEKGNPREWDVTEPTEADLLRYKVEEEKMFQEYAEDLDTTIKGMEESRKENLVGKPKEKEAKANAEEVEQSAVTEEAKEAKDNTTTEGQILRNPDRLALVKEELEGLNQKIEEGKELSAKEERRQRFLDAWINDRDTHGIAEEELLKQFDYAECRFGGAIGKGGTGRSKLKVEKKSPASGPTPEDLGNIPF